MNGVLPAEFAILAHFDAVGIVLLILDRVIISLFAFRASYCNFYSHGMKPLSFHSLKNQSRSFQLCNFLPFFGAACSILPPIPTEDAQTEYHRFRRLSIAFFDPETPRK
jgi:hypothetical protein